MYPLSNGRRCGPRQNNAITGLRRSKHWFGMTLGSLPMTRVAAPRVDVSTGSFLSAPLVLTKLSPSHVFTAAAFGYTQH